MTKEGRLRRGKENYERKIFLDNPETLEYLESIKKEPTAKELAKIKAEEEKKAKSKENQ